MCAVTLIPTGCKAPCGPDYPETEECLEPDAPESKTLARWMLTDAETGEELGSGCAHSGEELIAVEPGRRLVLDWRLELLSAMTSNFDPPPGFWCSDDARISRHSYTSVTSPACWQQPDTSGPGSAGRLVSMDVIPAERPETDIGRNMVAGQGYRIEFDVLRGGPVFLQPTCEETESGFLTRPVEPFEMITVRCGPAAPCWVPAACLEDGQCLQQACGPNRAPCPQSLTCVENICQVESTP